MMLSSMYAYWHCLMQTQPIGYNVTYMRHAHNIYFSRNLSHNIPCIFNSQIYTLEKQD